MNIVDKALVAEDLKLNKGFNCSQAVLEALKDDTGLDSATLKQIGAGFCAGMGTMEATCGALIGANIALGLKTEGVKTLMMSKKLLEEFKSMCGATKCGDLKKITDGKPLCPCNLCVKNAVLAYGKVLENN